MCRQLHRNSFRCNPWEYLHTFFASSEAFYSALEQTRARVRTHFANLIADSNKEEQEQVRNQAVDLWMQTETEADGLDAVRHQSRQRRLGRSGKLDDGKDISPDQYCKSSTSWNKCNDSFGLNVTLRHAFASGNPNPNWRIR